MSYKRREHVLTTNKSAIDTYLTVNSTPLYSSLYAEAYSNRTINFLFSDYTSRPLEDQNYR